MTAVGQNASSLAIEQELSTHPDVLEVSVVARPHERWGERPMAFVILHPQRATQWAGKHAAFADALKKHARARLPGFACPEWVQVVEELPVTEFLSGRADSPYSRALAAAAPGAGAHPLPRRGSDAGSYRPGDELRRLEPRGGADGTR